MNLHYLAALVLGIGMAVDSCVVTNERIKEILLEIKDYTKWSQK